jgi:hypothetical protein
MTQESITLPKFLCPPMTATLETYCTERSDWGSPHIAAALCHAWGQRQYDVLCVRTSEGWFQGLNSLQKAEIERLALTEAIQFLSIVEPSIEGVVQPLDIEALQTHCLQLGLLALLNEFLVCHRKTTLIPLLREMEEKMTALWLYQGPYNGEFTDPVLTELNKLECWWWTGKAPR